VFKRGREEEGTRGSCKGRVDEEKERRRESLSAMAALALLAGTHKSHQKSTPRTYKEGLRTGFKFFLL